MAAALRRLAFAARLLAVLPAVGASPLLRAQAPDPEPRPGADPPAADFHGLVPGVSRMQEVREKLGEPLHEASWYAWKMLWPAEGTDGGLDAVHMEGDTPEEGVVACIEAATVPGRLATRDLLLERVGRPEYRLVLPGGQELLDYSERGCRFVCDVRGRTIGAAYFPHGWRRVHAGARRVVDLSGLSQGPREPVPGPEPDLACGAAVVDITPSPETYEREFEVVAPLEARCAVFSRGEQRLAVVGADLFGLLKSEVDPIAERLRREGIDHLLLAVSHNHAAPDSIGIYGHYPERWVARVQERVVEGCLAARERSRPVKDLLLASDGLSLRGARVQGLFRNARNPGIVDPQVACVQARGPDGDPIATLVHFACHVEGLAEGPEEISPDFVGVMCERLRESTGAPAVFLNGAIGGMVSGDSRSRTHAEARKTGERLAGEVERLLGFATPTRSDAFSVRARRIEVPVTNPRFIAFEKLHADRRAYARGRVVSEMLHVRIGDCEMVTVPGELLPEVSFEILERMSGYPRMIVGLANDELGYMIPPYDFRAGSYEESMSVGPAIAPVVKETAWRLLGDANAPLAPGEAESEVEGETGG